MGRIYKINNTSGTLQINIHPGAKDGPAHFRRATDLNLHGFGSLQWGEEVDQNLLKMLENFSCPQKDYGAGDAQPPGVGGSPGATPNKIWPKSSNDTPVPGVYDPSVPNAGIVSPINGQIWFNTTTNRPYAFVAGADNGHGAWRNLGGATVSDVPPAQPSVGDLWFKTGDVICDQNQTMIFDPDHCEAPTVGPEIGWVSLSQNYIKRCGTTTVCGELIFNDQICATDPLCQGKIVGAVLEDVTIQNDALGPGDPGYGDTPCPRNEVYKYAFPQGTRLTFPQSCAPLGWATDTNADLHGRNLQVVSIPGTGLGEGGESDGIHDIWSMEQDDVPGHDHPSSASSFTGNHAHSGSTYNAGNHRHTGYTAYAGNHRHTYLRYSKHVGFTGSICCAWATPNANANTSTAGNHRHALSMSYSGNHAHSLSIAANGNHSHTTYTTLSTGPTAWQPKYHNMILAVKQLDEDVYPVRNGTSGNGLGTYC